MSDIRVKNIYINRDDEETWQRIHAAADAEKRGVGYFICRMFEKQEARPK
jgi:hypothetical protein